MSSHKAVIALLGYCSAGFMIQLLGIFWFRILCCTICSVGFLISFYEENNLLLFPGLIFVAFSQNTIYLTDAIAASLFGRYEGVSVILFAGAFDASSGIPLILKKIYPTYSLSKMLIFMTGLSSLMFLRTFFQMPYSMPNESFDRGEILKNTVFGKCSEIGKTRKNAVMPDQKEEHNSNDGKCLYFTKFCSQKKMAEKITNFINSTNFAKI